MQILIPFDFCWGIIAECVSSVFSRSLVAQLSDAMKSQHNQVQGFVTDLKKMMGRKPQMDETVQLIPLTAAFQSEGGGGDKGTGGFATANDTKELQKQTNEILTVIQNQGKKIDEEMKSIKEIVSVSRAKDSEGNVVYVGPEIKQLLEQTEDKIETRLKMNALWTVVFIYGGMALTVPVLYNIFR